MIFEEEIEILYNSSYGGWRLSEKAIELYKLRNPTLTEFKFSDYYNRDDPILVQIYKELGNSFDDKYSKTKIKKILKKYENYYDIEEYDGKEWIKINYTKYKLNNIYTKIKEILNSNNNNNTKVNELTLFISEFKI